MSLLFPASILQRRRRALPVPLLWLTLGLSLLAHLIALFVYWPEIFPKDKPESGGLGKTIRVQIAQPAPPRAPETPAQPQVAPTEPASAAPAAPAAPTPPRRTPPQRTPPPVMAKPSPQPPLVSTAPATPAPAATEPDMAQQLDARRRARAANSDAQAASAPVPPSALEDEKARRDAIVAANMGTIKAPTMGATQPRGGGVFSIRRVGIYDGEFLFYGWNRDINRQLSQVIEVKIGNNPNMQLAIVRRMIAIIRDHEKEDFTWQSPRQARVIRLSARQNDTAGLEDFLLSEFFELTRTSR